MHNAVSKAFHVHGWICASRPVEMLFCFITGTLAMINCIDWSSVKTKSQETMSQTYPWIDATIINTAGCIVLIHRISQFRRMHLLGSKFITGISAVTTIVTTLVFGFSAIWYLNCSLLDIKDALVFLFLSLDLSKISYMSQYSMEAQSYADAQKSMVEGISMLGPTLTLDSIVTALVVSAGTFSGEARIEKLCTFGVLSAVVYYITYMTFFLPFLSYVLELLSRRSTNVPPWVLPQHVAPTEKTTANPILQHVKRLMSGGLFLVHGIRRLSSTSTITVTPTIEVATETVFQKYFSSAVHGLFIFALSTLILKYIAYQSHDPLEELSPIMHTEKPITETTSTQTGGSEPHESKTVQEKRPLEECVQLLEAEDGSDSLSDEEILLLINSEKLQMRNLEQKLGCSRAVDIRRQCFSSIIPDPEAMAGVPYLHYDYNKVFGTCCENVVGYMPVPVGFAGPLFVDGMKYIIPLATTEGALVASTARGCKLLNQAHGGQGAETAIIKDGMTRAPIVEFQSMKRALELMKWIPGNFDAIKVAFDGTSRHTKLQAIDPFFIGRSVFLRFVAKTDDAMGMNMVGKATQAALKMMKNEFPDMIIVSISGNMCTDKKPSAINWIMGRGKSVVSSATLSGEIVEKILKVDVETLVDRNTKKNFIGSALAGSIGGNNAHAANIIAALFIACGQDPAQVVGSSACMTIMERTGPENEDLFVSVLMPCLEVGTVGGGTNLGPQKSCLKILGVQGSSNEPGENASRFARIASSAVMAAELSLMAALSTQKLIDSHMTLNRAKDALPDSK